jgi:hypothetical protein
MAIYILVSWLISCDVYTIYVRPNLVVLVFVRPNSSYVRPKLEVIGQMSCQVKYLFAALIMWQYFFLIGPMSDLPNLVGHCPMSDSNLQPCSSYIIKLQYCVLFFLVEKLLDERQENAAGLKFKCKRVGSMTDEETSELRNEIKVWRFHNSLLTTC